MKYLFSAMGKKTLAALSPHQNLMAFDFDGTLAPIVKSPKAARVLPRTQKLLKKLSRITSVAIISGRSLSDLEKRMDFAPSFLVGNHGLESPFEQKSILKKYEQTCRKWIRQIQKKISANIFLEDKNFSLSLHYKNSINKTKVKKILLSQVSHLNPKPKIILGKNVINLVPTQASNKGTALLKILKNSKYKKVLYIGDDGTDEDIFSLRKSHIITIRIGYNLSSKATFFLKNQSQIDTVLRQLLKLPRCPNSAPCMHAPIKPKA